jgi:hypothetical protein
MGLLRYDSVATQPPQPEPTWGSVDDGDAPCCKYCLESDHPENLFLPCHCTAPVHYECLRMWRSSTRLACYTACELCHARYAIDRSAVRGCAGLSCRAAEGLIVAVLITLYTLLNACVFALLGLAARDMNYYGVESSFAFVFFASMFYTALVLTIAVVSCGCFGCCAPLRRTRALRSDMTPEHRDDYHRRYDASGSGGGFDLWDYLILDTIIHRGHHGYVAPIHTEGGAGAAGDPCCGGGGCSGGGGGDDIGGLLAAVALLGAVIAFVLSIYCGVLVCAACARHWVRPLYTSADVVRGRTYYGQ